MRDINIFETDMFPYLEGEEIKEEILALTIKDIRAEEMQAHGGKKETKEVVYFAETKKGFVLNKTNSKTIAMMYGRQTGQWAGKQITLTTEPVQAFGQLHNALRVIPGAIPEFPDNNPSKGEFFKKASDAGFDPIEAARILRAAGFTNGYDPAQAPEMWQAVVAEYEKLQAAQPANDQPMPQSTAEMSAMDEVEAAASEEDEIPTDFQ